MGALSPTHVIVLLLLLALVVVPVILLVVVLVKVAGGRPSASSQREPAVGPREVLDRRLASGEITADEHERLCRRIAGDAPS